MNSINVGNCNHKTSEMHQTGSTHAPQLGSICAKTVENLKIAQRKTSTEDFKSPGNQHTKFSTSKVQRQTKVQHIHKHPNISQQISTGNTVDITTETVRKQRHKTPLHSEKSLSTFDDHSILVSPCQQTGCSLFPRGPVP